ncbi:hypothetical protein HMPREF3038_00439 [Akkermansia sp. KLE1797]|nr:hypothetical protein HMPREF3038_00439 [Akkermansia sp. KLE1797]KXU55644.1 hypothetical protein HMPREF3039_00201 [Akkermansia sp. KLE1798]KZA05426.1 hypothetical protein HMPREF1326_00833 [Akkermansia sp. KLE1605]
MKKGNAVPFHGGIRKVLNNRFTSSLSRERALESGMGKQEGGPEFLDPAILPR